jgi:hypothetical protein
MIKGSSSYTEAYSRLHYAIEGIGSQLQIAVYGEIGINSEVIEVHMT